MSNATKPEEKTQISPRDVANKSSKKSLYKAIEMALTIESEAVRRNTQTFNQNRYTAVAGIDDYDELKDQARAIKEHSIKNLPDLLEQLKKSVEARGGHFFLAKDKDEACNYIRNVCTKHEAKLVVKAKSITSEEIKLNSVLEDANIEVAETDLAEFILQVSDEQPSHIVAPAIHRSRERISRLFKENFDTPESLNTGEDLTKFARDILREKFLTADVGISGANLIAADTGTIVLVESEGNIRMVTQAPPVHIALAGIEKVIPTYKELAPFIELLAASATGQPLSTYTNILNPPLDLPSFSFTEKPKKEREFHLVMIDNGRMRMRDDPDLRVALYCLRCSACLNSCAIFQSLGGHAFGGETYSGGIGGAWEAGTGKLENARFSDLCSSCSRCVVNCPVRIDINWLNSVLRNRLNKLEHKNAPLQKQIFANYSTAAKIGTSFVPISNWVTRQAISKLMMEKIFGVDRRRTMPPFPSKTFTGLYKEWCKNNKQDSPVSDQRVVIFADMFTNYNHPKTGMATVNVFKSLGFDVRVSAAMSGGRAEQSQGMLEIAKKRAKKTAAYMEQYIDDKRDIIVVEPSVLALFRRDFYNLIENDALYEKLFQHSFDPVEYLLKHLYQKNIDLKSVFDISGIKNRKLFYHGQCQQKSIEVYEPTVLFLIMLGFDVVTSTVECCGMAGSFGYKKHFYEVSRRVADDLVKQIEEAEESGEKRMLVANGTSCREQLAQELNREVVHPVELLEMMLIRE